MTDPLVRLSALLRSAVDDGATEEERRTAAVAACRTIREHQILLVHPQHPRAAEAMAILQNTPRSTPVLTPAHARTLLDTYEGNTAEAARAAGVSVAEFRRAIRTAKKQESAALRIGEQVVTGAAKNVTLGALGDFFGIGKGSR